MVNVSITTFFIIAFIFGEYLHYTDKREKPNKEELKDYLIKNGHPDCEIVSTKPNIEDCFMSLMKEEQNAL